MNVFDFDNTIYDGESSVDFFLQYIKKDPSLVKFLPSVAVALLRYKSGKLSVEEALSKYGTKLTAYFKEKLSGNNTLYSDAESFWRTNIVKIKPFYESVKSEDDVIISCSPRFLLFEPLKRLGIKHCICSEIDENSGEITRLCFRENKVKAFSDEYPGETIDCLYTDSFNDKPLMDISKSVYLVKGNSIKKIK